MKFINVFKQKIIFNTINIKNLSIIFILLLSYIILSSYIYCGKVTSDLSRNVVRLHVIANSDSAYDQDIKYKVRNSVLEYMQKNSQNINSAEAARQFICMNLSNIEKISCDIMKSYDLNYKAKAYFGKFIFPTKVYGDVTLPSGEYEALRIVLGSGSGQNWWCVMFPPLCFVDASTGIVPDESKLRLKNVLSEEEYKLALGNSKDASSEIKIKFKIIEFLQQSKFILAKGKIR